MNESSFLRCILITGAAGFIPSNLSVYLVKKYPQVQFIGLDKMTYCSDLRNLDEITDNKNWTFYRCDLLNEECLSSIFERHPIDTVIHCAAYSHVDASFFNSIEFTRNNILGTHILLEMVRKYGKIEKFIGVSTDEVYGSQTTLSTEDSILDPTNPYAATKAAAEHLMKSYYHSFGLKLVITRGNNVYGPKQYPEKVIPRFALRLMKGEKCQIQGSGQQKRSFLHVDDVVRAFDFILFHGHIGEIYNIGIDKEYSVLEVATKMINILKPEEKIENLIEFIEDRNFNDQRYFISSEKLLKLGWSPEIDFETGLRQTIEWYEKRQDRWEI